MRYGAGSNDSSRKLVFMVRKFLILLTRLRSSSSSSLIIINYAINYRRARVGLADIPCLSLTRVVAE